MNPQQPRKPARPDLAAFRKQASEASGGISADTLYRRVTSEIRSLDLRGHVLDFGAGAGNFTEALLRLNRFDKISAADLFEPPTFLPEAMQWFIADLNMPLPAESASFDAIVSIETIEHLENPRAVAREWFRLLKPGGTLIFTTPNNDNVRSLLTVLVKGHFQLFTDPSYPAHISALLTKDVERITKEAGFVDLKISYEVPARLYGELSFKHALPFISRPGKRTAMHLIAISRKPI
jgi:2-polyprenyl-3-methyl-5-hydroxy-6-metoxy-1,4-benzoquinol methylase